MMQIGIRQGRQNIFGALILPLFVLFMSIGILSNPAQAAPAIASSACDADYYQSLSSRAWLEAQREITQNQNIILKPDSVFEYTCFDRVVRELADHAAQMFSETSAYGPPLGATSMDDALQNLVGTSLISYINNNYGSKASGGYNLLNGHIAATGIQHQPQSINNSGAYNCNVMARVWQAAKCINFTSYDDKDGFFTFQEYAGGDDKRHLPPNMACTPVSGSWQGNISTALTAGPWTNDPVTTYLGNLAPPNCSTGSCACSGAPIPTGLKVGGDSGRNEYVCLQPSCRHVPGSQNNGSGACFAR